MNRSLRKGITTLELISNSQYESINAIETNLYLENNILLISTKLKPVSQDQVSDVNYILKDNQHSISKIIFRDTLIRKKLESFVKAYSNKINSIKLQILYEINYLYNIKVTQKEDDTLIMTVQV